MLSSATLTSLDYFVERRDIILSCHDCYAPTRLADLDQYLHMADTSQSTSCPCRWFKFGEEN